MNKYDYIQMCIAHMTSHGLPVPNWMVHRIADDFDIIGREMNILVESGLPRKMVDAKIAELLTDHHRDALKLAQIYGNSNVKYGRPWHYNLERQFYKASGEPYIEST